MGLLPYNASVLGGRVYFRGVDLMQAGPEYIRSLRGHEVSMVFQDAQAALNPVEPIGSQLEEVIHQHTNMSLRNANRLAQETLREMGLPDPKRVMGQYPFALSGGMCQRVMMAIALVLRPKLLIADEPTSGLDVTLQAEMLERLRGLVREQGSSILLITHDMGVVASMANKVGVIYGGSLVEHADVIPLFRRAQHPYTWALLQSLPRLDDPGPQDTAPPRQPARYGEYGRRMPLPPPLLQGGEPVPPPAPPRAGGDRPGALRRLL